jgi:hypothetical protein
MKYNSEYFENLPVIEPDRHYTISSRDWDHIKRWIFWQYGIEADDAVVQAFIENEEWPRIEYMEEERWGECDPEDQWVIKSPFLVDRLDNDHERMSHLLESTPEYWAEYIDTYNMVAHLPYI